MLKDVRAVFFDIGETLGVYQPDPDLQTTAINRMIELLGIALSPDVFCQELEVRHKAYVRWREESLIEVGEEELWTRWLLPDLPTERTRTAARELTRLWRGRAGKRALREDAPSTVRELVRRGYVLGIISNTTLRHFRPAKMAGSESTR